MMSAALVKEVKYEGESTSDRRMTKEIFSRQSMHHL